MGGRRAGPGGRGITAVGVGVGVAVGTGTGTGDLALWTALGVAAGALIEFALSKRKRGKSDDPRDANGPDQARALTIT